MITRKDLIAKKACKLGRDWFMAHGLNKVENNIAITKTAEYKIKWGVWLANTFPHTLPCLRLKDKTGRLRREWRYDSAGRLIRYCGWKYNNKGMLVRNWDWKYEINGRLIQTCGWEYK